jgi:hypothetical protein
LLPRRKDAKPFTKYILCFRHIAYCLVSYLTAKTQSLSQTHLPIVNCQLSTANCQLQTAKFKLQTANC